MFALCSFKEAFSIVISLIITTFDFQYESQTFISKSSGNSTRSVQIYPSYPAGSGELAAFKLLNTQRQHCNFGSLKKNIQLTAAAQSHADYQILNNLDSHFQNVELYPVGFTGVSAMNRLAAHGYTDVGDVSDEYTIDINTTSKTGIGKSAIRSLLNAPYHLRNLMAGFRDVGISIRSSADLGLNNSVIYTQINLAYKKSEGRQAHGPLTVKTYPCNGTTGVGNKLVNESPNPVPGRDLFLNPLGPAVYVAVQPGRSLTITSASMSIATTGLPVVLRTPVTGANDPAAPCTKGCFERHEGYIIPDAPLLKNTAYKVTIHGLNNDVSFIRAFIFTTGKGPPA